MVFGCLGIQINLKQELIQILCSQSHHGELAYRLITQKQQQQQQQQSDFSSFRKTEITQVNENLE